MNSTYYQKSHVLYNLMIDSEWYAYHVEELERFCVQHEWDVKDNSYYIYLKGDTMFKHNRLLRIGSKGRFIGPVHEYLDTGANDTVPEKFHIKWSPSKKGMNQSSDRYYRDLGILLKKYHESKKEPSADRTFGEAEPRTVFYLAQTYDCLGESEEALKLYKERYSIQSGYREERYIAMYRAGKIYLTVKNQQSEGFFTLMEAFKLRPDRVEPLVLMAMNTLDPSVKHLFASRACHLPFPVADSLFIDMGAYDYHRWDQLGIAGYYSTNAVEVMEGLVAVHRAIRHVRQKPKEREFSAHLYLNTCYYHQKLQTFRSSGMSLPFQPKIFVKVPSTPSSLIEDVHEAWKEVWKTCGGGLGVTGKGEWGADIIFYRFSPSPPPTDYDASSPTTDYQHPYLTVYCRNEWEGMMHLCAFFNETSSNDKDVFVHTTYGTFIQPHAFYSWLHTFFPYDMMIKIPSYLPVFSFFSNTEPFFVASRQGISIIPTIPIIPIIPPNIPLTEQTEDSTDDRYSYSSWLLWFSAVCSHFTPFPISPMPLTDSVVAEAEKEKAWVHHIPSYFHPLPPKDEVNIRTDNFPRFLVDYTP